MNISIGIFTAEPPMENIKNATQQINENCAFTFLPYTSMDHLVALYKERAQQFDGLLFSGLLPYQSILSNLGAPQKPHGYLELTDRDYYRVILRVIHQNRGLDIHRILIDQLDDMPWTEIFGDNTAVPQNFIMQALRYGMHNDRFYSEVLETYTRLWLDREIDFVITRVTNLAQPLRERKIPFELLLPSHESMRENIMKLIQEIQSNHIVDALSAIGVLQPENNLSTEDETQLLEHLGELNHRYGILLILRQSELGIEIITSNNVLRELTDSYGCCLVSGYIHEHCDIPFCLGWGVGFDVMHAQQNAVRALKESQRSKERYPYLITEQDELVGPLARGKSVSLSTAPGKDANILAKKLGISPTNMQKLLTIQRWHNNPRLNRDDLALYLNVTLRTANRILTKLSQTGAARVVATEQSPSAGRPMAVYELRLDNLSR